MATSVAATAMLIRSAARDLFPRGMSDFFFGAIREIFHRFSSQLAVVLTSCLPSILQEAKLMKREVRALRIFMARHVYRSLNDALLATKLDHPATFETLALDPDIKKFMMEDLERFSRRKEYYRKVGKAWKRGYLTEYTLNMMLCLGFFKL